MRDSAHRSFPAGVCAQTQGHVTQSLTRQMHTRSRDRLKLQSHVDNSSVAASALN